MSCGCLGVLYKPRYRRQVDAIYPRDPMDEKLIRAEMDKLTYYTLHHPEKLDRIGSYLESIMEDGLYKKQDGWIKVSIDAIVELLKPCHAQRIQLFVASYLKMCFKLLDSPSNSFKLYGTHAFVQFSEKEEDSTVQVQDFSKFIQIFCDLCRESKTKDQEELRNIRISGIKGLQGVLRKTLQEKQRDDLLNQHSKIIIPALLFNLQENIEDLGQSDAEDDDDSPRGMADQVLRELLSRVTLSQICQVISPLLDHLDDANLWPTENSVAWAKLFMRSVRESYSQMIVKLILDHVRKKNFEKQYEEIGGILHVVSEVCVIPGINSLGSIAQELFIIIADSISNMPRDSVLCSKYIKTSGVICSNLQNYIQIEVLGYILEEVAKSVQASKVSILLQIMAHCSTFFKPTKENEQVILNSFVRPLLELSQDKAQVLETDEVLLIGRMITKVLDHQSNLPSLSRSGSWRSQVVELSLAKSSSSQLRRLSRNLVAWIYEQLKRNDNQAPNFIVYYTLVGVLLAENTDRSELSIQLLKVFLAIQDHNRIDDVFENSLKCQTHACIGAVFSFMTIFLEPITSHVNHALNERQHNKPQLAPDSLFSGSSDALRRSTASLYSRSDNKDDFEKYFFNRQILCDALRTSGIDISGLSDPLGASDLEIKEFPDMSGHGKLSSDVSADDISLKFPFGNTSNSRDFSQLTQKDKAFSFTDLLTPYKAVPQTLEELNKRNAIAVAEFKKKEFEQIVSSIQEEHRAQNEILTKLLSYSDHLQDSGIFVDQEDSDYPSLFF